MLQKRANSLNITKIFEYARPQLRPFAQNKANSCNNLAAGT